MLQDIRMESGLYKTWNVVSLLINIGDKLRNFLVNNIVYKKYFQKPCTGKYRALGDTEFLYNLTQQKNKFDLRSYREIDVITSKACVVLLITQAIASRNDIMAVDRT